MKEGESFANCDGGGEVTLTSESRFSPFLVSQLEHFSFYAY